MMGLFQKAWTWGNSRVYIEIYIKLKYRELKGSDAHIFQIVCNFWNVDTLKHIVGLIMQ